MIDFIGKYCVSQNKSSNHTNSYTYLVKFREVCDELIQVSYKHSLKLKLIKYVYPIFLPCIVGNCISLFLVLKIYRSRRKENRNFLFFLAIICCFDLFLLTFDCLREYLEEVLGYRLRSHSIISCKLLYLVVYFLNSVLAYLSALIAL
jgi:Na+-translocating ferredoxin:NAD+ oxidoreductase RnfA subunit